MDKVDKTITTQYYTPASKPFRIYPNYKLSRILESGTLRHCMVTKGSPGVDEMNECVFRMGQTRSEQILTLVVLDWALQWLKMAWK
jgi:hypothetical protein